MLLLCQRDTDIYYWAQTSERLLPQWLTGIIAVAGFLFLTFVGLLVKKAWCEEPSRSGHFNFIFMFSFGPKSSGPNLHVLVRRLLLFFCFLF
uniref:Uncharacterized protein n=1 Tax=Cyclopterus lumpus TaxID=8103 RepID=A0A8C2WGL5_CYCLU